MTDKRKNLLLRSLLFSGLGALACLLMGRYTDLPREVTEHYNTLWMYLFFIAGTNLLGYLTILLSAWLSNQYMLRGRSQGRLFTIYAIVMTSTLAANYVLFVITKLLSGASPAFLFPHGGFPILILVWMIELVVIGLLSANKSMQDTLRLQKHTAALQEENNAARYAALQNQLNPHFLFNSLNTLVAEIEYDPQRAVAFTRNLSDVYRYVLQCQDKRLITLSEELKFAESYLYLHKVRLGDCINLRVLVPQETSDNLLPPLTLQLLLENVIKHNTISANRPMEISVTAAEGWLTVTNTLQVKKVQSSEGVGLKNLANRCRMALDSEVKIEKTNDLFTVIIPLLYE